MSNKRKGQTVAASEWAKHLRPDGRREFWKAQRQADKSIVASGDDASVKPAFTEHKKKARKQRNKRPFVLQYRYTRISSSFTWMDGKWRDWQSYDTARARDDALSAQVKGDNHGFSAVPICEWRAIDRKA